MFPRLFNSSNNRRGINNRLLEITLATGATREFVYQLADRSFGVNEILAINDHEFLVIERDGNAGAAAAFKQIVKIDVAGATDVSGILLPQTGLPAGVTPVTKTAFLDLLSPAFGLAGATFPEKIEGLAFGPDLPDGRHLLLVTSDNDFFPDNPSRVYAFAIEGTALAGFQPQTMDRRLAVLGVARLWLGLKNSDDQGARFDVRVQVEKDGVPVATGELHCVTGIVRNPDKALEVIVPFPTDPAIAVGAGDVITVSVRAGTTPTGAFCGGHASATGVRLYYDSATRPARVGELYLHRASGGTFDSIAPLAGPPALKDSPATTLSGGNPWRLAGTWALTP